MAASARIKEERRGRKARNDRKATFSLRASRALRSTPRTAAVVPSATSTTATRRQAPGAESQGSAPNPPASEPRMAPAVFAA